MSFFARVGKRVGEMEDDLHRELRAIHINLFSAVIKDTPVDTGQLRGNWILTESSPANNQRVTNDISGNATTNEATSRVTRLDFSKDTEVYLVNNLPYAARIEYDGWSHTKAPAGMVRINLEKTAAAIRRRGNR